MCFLAGSLALPSLNIASAEWKKFKELNKKIYNNVAEEMLRLKMYMANKVAILAHNLKYKLGQVKYQVGMNKFGDLLEHEFTDVSGGYDENSGPTTRAANTYMSSGKPLPASVDLRRSNLVNEPRNQGRCGSCWTFSTTGALEGALAKKTGRLIGLSQQNLLDCSTKNKGCKGGRPDKAFTFVKTQGGINPEAIYQYTGVQGPCRFDPNFPVAKVANFLSIEAGNDHDLADALANVGPVSIAIDARSRMLKFYSSGIFSPPASECSSTKLTHAVLAIGYGVENGQKYWLVKNSWGTDWGENGFVRILNNGQNLCGVTTVANFPVLQ